MKIRYLLLLPLLAATVGCLTEEKRIYQASMKNNTGGPVTVWLVKENGPAEPGWLSPEQFAAANPLTDDKLPDVIVPAGKSINPGPIEGEFDRGRGRAYLRVYDGTPTLTQMLAISRDSLARLNLILEPMPSSNIFVVDEKEGYLNATRLRPTTEPVEK